MCKDKKWDKFAQRDDLYKVMNSIHQRQSLLF